ncbi:MAG: hypothetical protein Q9225_005044 [Loekoesia sp. 1 TL-2023]
MAETPLHAAIPARAASGSSFEWLPLEIQRMIIRYTMPHGGIIPKLPQDPQYLYEDEELVWEEDSCFYTYLRELENAESGDAVVPLSLFQVSKTISSIAASVFNEEVPLVINITPACIHFLSTVVSKFYEYPSYKSFAHIQHFRRMQNFELNLDFSPELWSPLFKEELDPEGISWWSRHKEWLRTICDVLMMNDSIQHLIVRLPCFCSLTTTDLVSQAEVIMLDLLAPLRRLRVTNVVRFDRPHYVTSLETDDCKMHHHARGFHVCNEGLGKNLVEVLQGKLGRLDGEGLDHREGTWKMIKAMDRASPEPGNLASRDIEDRLDAVHCCLQHFARPEAIDSSGLNSETSHCSENCGGLWNGEIDSRCLRAFDYFAYEAYDTIKRAWEARAPKGTKEADLQRLAQVEIHEKITKEE